MRLHTDGAVSLAATIRCNWAGALPQYFNCSTKSDSRIRDASGARTA